MGQRRVHPHVEGRGERRTRARMIPFHSLLPRHPRPRSSSTPAHHPPWPPVSRSSSPHCMTATSRDNAPRSEKAAHSDHTRGWACSPIQVPHARAPLHLRAHRWPPSAFVDATFFTPVSTPSLLRSSTSSGTLRPPGAAWATLARPDQAQAGRLTSRLLFVPSIRSDRLHFALLHGPLPHPPSAQNLPYWWASLCALKPRRSLGIPPAVPRARAFRALGSRPPFWPHIGTWGRGCLCITLPPSARFLNPPFARNPAAVPRVRAFRALGSRPPFWPHIGTWGLGVSLPHTPTLSAAPDRAVRSESRPAVPRARAFRALGSRPSVWATHPALGAAVSVHHTPTLSAPPDSRCFALLPAAGCRLARSSAPRALY
ncbi:hypothetical protein B0H14DRAFT_3762707 [Mycena olivaceomarginata]|nr:hypothetical protein B0H14DRAFT_3762707 [Mycena olivaceomarginata]